MTMITSQEGPSSLVDSISEVELQLMDLKSDLREMQMRIRAGDVATRLCCTNRVRSVLLLSPDGLILRAL